MNPPSLINILGHRYTVSEWPSDLWAGNGLGRSDIATAQLSLKSTIPADLKKSTLLHEIIHQLADLLDLPMKESELAISGLAVGLYNVLRANPTLVVYLTKDE